MTVEVHLVKKNVRYTAQDGAEKRAVNLYIQVGTVFVPIEVKFFPNDKCEGRDPAFAARVAILTAIAEEIPQVSTPAEAAKGEHET